MAEALRLEIIVDDKGTAVLRQFAGETQKVATQLGQGVTQPLQEATKASDTFGTSLLSSIRTGAGFAVGFAGVAGVTSLLGAAATAASTFQVGMANVSTLMAGPAVEGTARLRAQLLDLPPILGTTTELTKGLYSTLSAGIDASKSVEFLGTAAKAARAGMTDLSTTVDTIGGVLQVYTLNASEATKVSDLMFQTVNVGRGTFEQFSRAFAIAAPIGKQLGVTFEELSATLGTLSFAFPTAAEAGTGLQSILAGLIQNSAEFAAMGINVKQVIAEEGGLTGLLRKMATVTGGNEEAMLKLIGRVEGLRGVLAILGSQSERHTENMRAMGMAAGSTEEAFKKQSATFDAAWKSLVGTMDHLVQRAAPPFLAAATSMANTLGGTLVVSANAAGGAFEIIRAGLHATGESLSRIPAQMQGLTVIGPALNVVSAAFLFLKDTLTGTTPAQREHTAAVKAAEGPYKTASQLARERGAAEEELKFKTQAVTTAGMALANAEKTLADLRVSGTATAQQLAQAQQAVTVTGQANAKAILEQQQAQEKATVTTAKAAGAINELEQFTNRQIEASAKLAQKGKLDAEALQNAYVGLGQKTRAELKILADGAFTNFQKIAADGKEPPERLQALWKEAVEVIKKFYRTLPVEMAQVNAEIEKLRPPSLTFAKQMEADFASFGQKSVLEMKKLADESLAAFKRIEASGMALPEQLPAMWDKTVEKILAAYGELPPAVARIDDRIKGHTTESAEETSLVIYEAHGKIRREFEETGDTAEHVGGRISHAFTQSAELSAASWANASLSQRASMQAVQDAADQAWGTIAQRAQDLQDLTSKSMQDLLAWAPKFERAFADTTTGLLAQLREVEQTRNAALVSNETRLPGYIEYIQKTTGEATDAIRAKLKALGVDDSGLPLPGAKPTAAGSSGASGGSTGTVPTTIATLSTSSGAGGGAGANFYAGQQVFTAPMLGAGGTNPVVPAPGRGISTGGSSDTYAELMDQIEQNQKRTGIVDTNALIRIQQAADQDRLARQDTARGTYIGGMFVPNNLITPQNDLWHGNPYPAGSSLSAPSTMTGALAKVPAGGKVSAPAQPGVLPPSKSSAQDSTFTSGGETYKIGFDTAYDYGTVKLAPGQKPPPGAVQRSPGIYDVPLTTDIRQQLGPATQHGVAGPVQPGAPTGPAFASGGGYMVQTRNAGHTINVNVTMPPGMTATDANAFTRQIAPAINQAIRRGDILT